AAKLPPERTLPPVGPVRDDLADLILDPDHAAAVRLTDQTLAELTALRLQLTALDDGAEASVVLVSPATDGGPGDPL
ncbi:hypothetical protein NL526_30560, partial [Klebsiella pneumoniae]|nr:hypothetical protein [Klebsiella pneumoniae]